MTEVLLFHHAQGLTRGVLAFADVLRAAGHAVHTPDLYEGKTFEQLDDGVAYAQATGFSTIFERGQRAAEGLPSELVYGGFSLGVPSAQNLAMTRPGARGALLFSGCVPPSEFGGDWPNKVPVQIHMMEHDPWVVDDGDLEAARQLAATAEQAELFLYPGKAHLFADNSLADYDEGSAQLLLQRVLTFVQRVG